MRGYRWTRALFQVERCVFTGPKWSDPVSTHLNPSASLKVRVFVPLIAWANTRSRPPIILRCAFSGSYPKNTHLTLALPPKNTHLKSLLLLRCAFLGPQNVYVHAGTDDQTTLGCAVSGRPPKKTHLTLTLPPQKHAPEAPPALEVRVFRGRKRVCARRHR